jgi:hypothetical protein
METAATWLRWARAGTLATVATLLAVWAHVHAGGLAPSMPVLAFLVLALTAAAAALLGRPASTFRVVLLTVGGQAVAHQVLGSGLGPASGLMGGATSMATMVTQTSPAAHHAGHVVDAGPAGVTSVSSALLSHLAAADARMICAHLAAAVVVGLWLAAGERAVWSVVTHIWRSLGVPAVLLPVSPAPHVAVAQMRLGTMLLRIAIGSVVRRGPPARLLAL